MKKTEEQFGSVVIVKVVYADQVWFEVRDATEIHMAHKVIYLEKKFHGQTPIMQQQSNPDT